MSIGGLDGDLKVELINQVGVIVSSSLTNAAVENYKINMTGLQTGFYFVKVTNSSNQSFVRKVIKL